MDPARLDTVTNASGGYPAAQSNSSVGYPRGGLLLPIAQASSPEAPATSSSNPSPAPRGGLLLPIARASSPEAPATSSNPIPASRVGLFLPIARASSPYAPATPSACPAAPACLRDACETDLHHFHGRATLQVLQNGEITKVKTLRECIHGKVLKVRWNKEGFAKTPLVAKKMPTCQVMHNVGKEANERTAHWLDSHSKDPSRCPHTEDAFTEIGVYTWLAKQSHCPRWLLRMQACLQDETHTYLCTEYAEGGEVFDHVLAQQGQLFPTEQIMTHIWQLLQAVKYLHSNHIGHRDICLENILLQGGEFRLMDFGMAVKSHSSKGVPLRFFRATAKPYYRPPEAYVPAELQVSVTVPANAVPGSIVQASSRALYEVLLPDDAVPGHTCDAEVCGYEAMPGDIFACGVSFIILTWQRAPWERALPALITAWKMPVDHLSGEALALLSSMVSGNPRERPTIVESLSSPCFASCAASAEDTELLCDGSESAEDVDATKGTDDTVADTTIAGSDTEITSMSDARTPTP